MVLALSLGVTFSIYHRPSLFHQMIEGDVVLGKEVVADVRGRHSFPQNCSDLLLRSS